MPSFVRILEVVIAIALSMGAVAACSESDPIPDVHGRITATMIAPSDMQRQHLRGFVKVEASRRKAGIFEKADVTITDTTAIVVAHGGVERSGAFTDLAEGDSAAVFFGGPTYQGDPVLATGARVIVWK